MAREPLWAKVSVLLRFHYHTHYQTHHTLCDFCGRVLSPTQRPLTQHTGTFTKHTSNSLAGFEPAILEIDRPQTHVIDRTTTWICTGCISTGKSLTLTTTVIMERKQVYVNMFVFLSGYRNSAVWIDRYKAFCMEIKKGKFRNIILF
jgi:hypothetical protein